MWLFGGQHRRNSQMDTWCAACLRLCIDLSCWPPLARLALGRKQYFSLQLCMTPLWFADLRARPCTDARHQHPHIEAFGAKLSTPGSSVLASSSMVPSPQPCTLPACHPSLASVSLCGSLVVGTGAIHKWTCGALRVCVCVWTCLAGPSPARLVGSGKKAVLVSPALHAPPLVCGLDGKAMH